MLAIESEKTAAFSLLIDHFSIITLSCIIFPHEGPQIGSDMQWKLAVLSVVNNVNISAFVLIAMGMTSFPVVDLPSTLCPCKGPIAAFPESKYLSSWDDYCKWRDIPLYSPVALLLQRPLLILCAIELVGLRNFGSGKQLYIHYLGPEKELLQVAAFGELRALFPVVQINIDIIGSAVPKHRDDETIELHKYAKCAEDECECKCKCKIAADSGHSCPVILKIRRGLSPHLFIAPNAGIAAYSSWLPTIVPEIFSDYCEEACLMGSRCISSVTG